MAGTEHLQDFRRDVKSTPGVSLVPQLKCLHREGADDERVCEGSGGQDENYTVSLKSLSRSKCPPPHTTCAGHTLLVRCMRC